MCDLMPYYLFCYLDLIVIHFIGSVTLMDELREPW